MMRPRHFETQLVLADAGSCRAAAKPLGTSRSALAIHQRQVEGEAGFSLFSRIRKGVVPKELGLAHHACAGSAKAELSGSDREASGPWGQLALINGLAAVRTFTVRLLDRLSAELAIDVAPVRGNPEPRTALIIARTGRSPMPHGERLADCAGHRADPVACERAGTKSRRAARQVRQSRVNRGEHHAALYRRRV